MGRSYKTAKPTFVDDVIYQAPHELMAMALKAQDENFEDTIKPLQGTESLFEGLEYADKDSEYRQKMMKQVNDKIEDLTQKAYDNPALARGLRGEINKTRKDLEYSIKAGDFHQVDRNAKTRNKVIEEIKARKDISDRQKAAAITAYDHNFKGTKEGGKYEDSMHIYEKLDVQKFITTKKAQMTADSIKTSENRTDGRYFTTESGEKRFISQEKLDKIFTNSDGVKQWSNALLQTLEREVTTGKIPKEDVIDDQGNVIQKGMDSIFTDKYESFKKEFESSLGFTQFSDSTIKTKDNRDIELSKLSMQKGRYKKEMEELDQTGKVIIERDTIPVPASNLTTEDKENQKYNESSKNLVNEIKERLKASGKYSKKVKNFGVTPKEITKEEIITDEEALNRDALEESNRVREILKSNNIEAKRELIQTYGKEEITNLLNFQTNKKEEYNSETMTAEEKKTFKSQTYATIPSDFIGQVTLPDGSVKNMTREEFEKTAETLIPTKKTVEKAITIKGEEFEGGKAGKIYAAYEADGGIILPIKTNDTKEAVLERDYDKTQKYASGKKQGVKKEKQIVGIAQPFDIKKMDISTTSKLKYVNPLQTAKKDEKLNIHVQTSDGPMIWRIKKPTNNTFIQNK